MGEWSEYFEDFPEENPANWHNPEDDAEKRMGKYSEFFLTPAVNPVYINLGDFDYAA